MLGGDQAQVEMNNPFEYAMESNKVEEIIHIPDDPIGHDDEQFESNNLFEDTFANLSNGFECNKCDFVAKTEVGLKTHKKKKHRNNQN